MPQVLPPSSSQPPNADVPLPLLRVRLSNVSATMATPVPELDKTHSGFSPDLASLGPSKTQAKKRFFKMPVIRVFGVTEAGQRACVNIHGAFPYIYVNYPTEESLDPNHVRRFINRLGAEINLALAKAPAGQDGDQGPAARRAGFGFSSTNANAIEAIRLVKGTPFYGYHVGFAYYLRISFLKQSHRWTLLKMLGEEDMILSRRFKVYEAHLGFVLQFMCDFGLGGCGWLDIHDARFREPLPPSPRYDEDGSYGSQPQSQSQSQSDLPLHLRVWHAGNIPPYLLHPAPLFPVRSSRSAIEVDIHVNSILNRHRITARRLHDDFFEYRGGLRSDKKLVDSLEELFEDERRRMRAAGKLDDSAMGKLSYGDRQGKADELPGKGVGWSSEERWWDEIQRRIDADNERGVDPLTLDSFIEAGERAMTEKQREQMELYVPTTLEALIRGWRTDRLPSRLPPPEDEQAEPLMYPATPFASQPRSSYPAEVEYANSDDATSSPIKSRFDEARLAAVAARAAREKDWDWQTDADALDGAPAEAEGDEKSQPWEDDGGFVEDTEIRMSQSQGSSKRTVRPSNGYGKGKAPQRNESSPGYDTPSKPPTRRPRSQERTPPPVVANYPHSHLFAADSTREQRKSRSPNSPARPKPLSIYSPAHPTAPATPSTLRHVLEFGHSSDSSAEDVSDESGDDVKLGDSSPIRARPSQSTAPVRPLRGPSPVKPTVKTGPAHRRSKVKIQKPLSQIANPYAAAFIPLRSLPPVHSAADCINGEDDVSTKRRRTRSPSPPAFTPSRLVPTLVTGANGVDQTPLVPTLVSSSASQAGQSQAINLTPTLRSSFATRQTPSSTATGRPQKRVRYGLEDLEEEDGVSSAQIGRQASPRLSPVEDKLEEADAEPTQAVDPPGSSSPGRDRSSSLHISLSSVEQTPSGLLASLEDVDSPPDVEYLDPFFSNLKDLPRKPREYGGQVWHIGGKKVVPLLPKLLPRLPKGMGSARRNGTGTKDGVLAWELNAPAPTRGEVGSWVAKEKPPEENRKKKVFASQFEGPTQKNTQGFKFSQISEASTSREKQFMSVMSLEIIAVSKDDRLPFHKEDEVLGVFYCFQSDGDAPDNCKVPGCHVGIILRSSLEAFDSASRFPPHDIVPDGADSEIDLIHLVVDKVRLFDPDILSGWEVQSSSWGYLSRRMQVYGLSLSAELSPVDEQDPSGPTSQYNSEHSTDFQVDGRHVFNLWRLLRGDLTLNQYTLENVAFHLLHRRIPKYTPQTLFSYLMSDLPALQAKAMNHLLARTIMVIEMLDISEMVSKNAEFARVYGVDFSDVYMRGSQFKVESFMFRLAKPESLLLQTPSKDEVGGQDGAECIPLIMEPQSAFFKDPVVVLDFQSLYPSIMIAYNICYSTCLGRADRLPDKQGNPTDRFGFSTHKLVPGTLELLEDFITVSPNGMMFVKPTLRKSLLAKMLGELLDTRVMVKTAMKGYKYDKGLSRVLNARQLALKLLANVTYGYTSASFSGRMPHIQVADSIVQYGRETLEKAKELIESNPKWRAKVVYGDTDSLFIHLPGRSREQAFLLGNEMADAVTALNPKPMKLKFEKVYLPCVLQTKKRYVGNKFEHPDELVGVYEAKGIETVRRDGIPAQQKELEECIKILFRTQDLSLVKEYLYRQWKKLIQGKISVQDFTFAKEVRLGTYSEKSRPPHVIVAAIRAELDPSDEPQYGERVPYLIAQGSPNEPQYKRARRPEDFLADRHLRLDCEYYIRNILIPPLGRIFNLLGADVESWYNKMPRPKWIAPPPFPEEPLTKKGRKNAQLRMTDYYKSSLCFLCGTETKKIPAVCEKCLSNPPMMAYDLLTKYEHATSRLRSAQLVCASCTSSPASDAIKCESLDCGVLYARVGAEREVADLAGVGEFIEQKVGRGGMMEEKKEKKAPKKKVVEYIDGTDW